MSPMSIVRLVAGPSVLAVCLLLIFIDPHLGMWLGPKDAVAHRIVAFYIPCGLIALVLGIYVYRFVMPLIRARKFDSGLSKRDKKGGGGMSVADRKLIEAVQEEFTKGIDKLKESDEYQKEGKSYFTTRPWYLIAGPSGCGKTTIVRKSGVNLHGGDMIRQGMGGTRHFHWWFTEQGIFLDTAGNLTEAKDDSAAGQQWRRLLKLVKETRPLRPIEGLFLVFPANVFIDGTLDTFTTEGEIKEQWSLKELAAWYRNHLDELRQFFGVDIPVYVMLSKCDLIPGFASYFENATDHHERLLGWTNHEQSRDDNPRPVIEEGLHDTFSKIAECRIGYLERIDSNLYPKTANQVYNLPEQLSKLGDNILTFADILFRRTEGYTEGHLCRGIYFTAARQGGQRSMALANELAKELGLERAEQEEAAAKFEEQFQGGETLSDAQPAFFVRDIVETLLPVDKKIAYPTPAALKKRRRKATMLTVGPAVLTLLISLWGWLSIGSSKTEFAEQKASLKSVIAALKNPGSVKDDQIEGLIATLTKLGDEDQWEGGTLGLYGAEDDLLVHARKEIAAALIPEVFKRARANFRGSGGRVIATDDGEDLTAVLSRLNIPDSSESTAFRGAFLILEDGLRALAKALETDRTALESDLAGCFARKRGVFELPSSGTSVVRDDASGEFLAKALVSVVDQGWFQENHASQWARLERKANDNTESARGVLGALWRQVSSALVREGAITEMQAKLSRRTIFIEDLLDVAGETNDEAVFQRAATALLDSADEEDDSTGGATKIWASFTTAKGVILLGSAAKGLSSKLKGFGIDSGNGIDALQRLIELETSGSSDASAPSGGEEDFEFTNRVGYLVLDAARSAPGQHDQSSALDRLQKGANALIFARSREMGEAMATASLGDLEELLSELASVTVDAGRDAVNGAALASESNRVIRLRQEGIRKSFRTSLDAVGPEPFSVPSSTSVEGAKLFSVEVIRAIRFRASRHYVRKAWLGPLTDKVASSNEGAYFPRAATGSGAADGGPGGEDATALLRITRRGDDQRELSRDQVKAWESVWRPFMEDAGRKLGLDLQATVAKLSGVSERLGDKSETQFGQSFGFVQNPSQLTSVKDFIALMKAERDGVLTSSLKATKDGVTDTAFQGLVTGVNNALGEATGGRRQTAEERIKALEQVMGDKFTALENEDSLRAADFLTKEAGRRMLEQAGKLSLSLSADLGRMEPLRAKIVTQLQGVDDALRRYLISRASAQRDARLLAIFEAGYRVLGSGNSVSVEPLKDALRQFLEFRIDYLLADQEDTRELVRLIREVTRTPGGGDLDSFLPEAFHVAADEALRLGADDVKLVREYVDLLRKGPDAGFASLIRAEQMKNEGVSSKKPIAVTWKANVTYSEEPVGSVEISRVVPPDEAPEKFEIRAGAYRGSGKPREFELEHGEKLTFTVKLGSLTETLGPLEIYDQFGARKTKHVQRFNLPPGRQAKHTVKLTFKTNGAVLTDSGPDPAQQRALQLLESLRQKTDDAIKAQRAGR